MKLGMGLALSMLYHKVPEKKEKKPRQGQAEDQWQN